MKIEKTPIEGLLILQTDNFHDNRGSFQKLFNYDFFVEYGLATDFKEFYYSLNHKNVVRGMHFQTPPADHVKMVYVSHGRIMDAVVDLRKDSATYGQVFRSPATIRLSSSLPLTYYLFPVNYLSNNPRKYGFCLPANSSMSGCNWNRTIICC